MPSVQRLYREEIDLGVGRSGRFQDFVAHVPARMIHRPIVFAKWIQDRLALLQFPAAVENVLRHLPRAPADPRRLELVDRPANSVGHPPDEKALVLVERIAHLQGIGAAGADSAVRMRGRHHHVRRGQAGRLVDEPLRLVEHLARHPDVVHHHKRQARRAVIEHETPGMQFVVNVRRRISLPAAHPGHAQGRRDVAGDRSRRENAATLFARDRLSTTCDRLRRNADHDSENNSVKPSLEAPHRIVCDS